MKNSNKIFFGIFITVWVILIILNFVYPKITFSEQENRVLAKVPTFSFEKLVKGTYAEGLDNYINDHFVFRNFWLNLKSSMEIASGKTENNNVYIGKEGYLFEKFNYADSEKEQLEDKIAIIEKFANNNADMPIYFMLVPNSIYINREYLPDNVQVYSQSEIIKDVYNKTTNVSNITNIETVEALESLKEHYLYYKTDHHTTSNGAYVLYLKYCQYANIKPTTIENYEIETVSNEFLGSFDSKAQVYNQEKDEIFIYKNSLNTDLREVIYDGNSSNSIYNEDYLGKKDKYAYFLNGSNSNVVVKTNNMNGEKLLVIKDSYAHNMTQFLCQNYEEIHFIDLRYYNDSISDYIRENGITQTFIMYNVSTLVSDIGILKLR